MNFLELVWLALAIIAGLVAFFWTLATMWNLLHPRITINAWRILLDAVIIAIASVSWVFFLNLSHLVTIG